MALTDGLVAYWKLDEVSDVDAVDATGNGNTLTDNNGVAATTGILNNGRTFVAANSEKLTIADNTDLSFGDEDMSISFWIYYTSATPNTPILGKWDWGVSSDNEYIVYLAPGPDIRFDISQNGSTSAASVQSAAISTSTWYHVVVYHDATANEIGLILNDGTPVTASISGGIRDGTHAFEIGGMNSAYSNIARLDEVGVWNKVLSAEEITSLYNSGSALSYGDFNPAPSASLYVPAPSATRMAPCPVFASVNCGRRKEMIGSTTYGWTNTTGSEYSMDVGLSTIGITGSGAVSNVRVKEGTELSDAYLTEGSGTGALNASEWFLDGDTLHVRLSDSTNPQSAATGGLQVSFDVGTTGDSLGWQYCRIEWQISGSGLSSLENRWRYVTDPRPRLSNRQIDLAGQTDTDNYNRPRGYAMGWVLGEGTWTITAIVTNSSGNSTTLTENVVVAADSRTPYTVGSGQNYDTLADAMSAQGLNNDIRLTIADGHTENFSTGYDFSNLDNWVVEWEGGSTEPLFTYNGSGAGSGNVFSAAGSENCVFYGLQIEDGSASGDVASGTFTQVGFRPGDFTAVVRCAAVGAAGSEAVTRFVDDVDNYGLLVQDCTTDATYTYTYIPSGGTVPQATSHIIFLGNDFGPSETESCWRVQVNQHYVTVAWSKHVETSGTSHKSALRISAAAFVQVYGCWIDNDVQQSWVGRTNAGQGIGASCVRIEACHTDSMYLHEDAAEALYISCYADSTYAELGSVSAQVAGGLIYDSGVLHCTIAGGSSFSASQWALTSGTDYHSGIKFNGNAWHRDATVDYFLRFGEGTGEINRNHLYSESVGTALVSVWVGGTENRTISNVTNLNAESFATGNVADSFTLDADFIPSSPQTVTTEPGVFDDYYGNARDSTSYAGAVIAANPSSGGGSSRNLLLLGVG